ncbi:aspartate kinase [Olsenella sp. YH-ols2217]|uniref:Aspartokinase n=1 Tax=Kribbibacterium absianum TaxID=3044210 RepID=A0ABT6ZLX3_9ACTN|nr:MULTISPECIES: aspartate kinase [unclassified Olsenella]MDJ1122045.1 aspartate kinase [Olsenella sp. YH-ols2216]MDJ1130053.1 aspartate kinase [Olsenella sp. YH-ols2217]
MIKITKFGGSSVASADQFAKVKSIIEGDPSRRFVVVSAAGKRFSGDNKVTDLLYLVNAHKDYHVDYSGLMDDIEGRFLDIQRQLGLTFPVEEKFDELRGHLKTDSPEYVISRGEWFTAHLMAEYLGLPFVDAADAIIFHHDGSLDLERTAARVRDVVVRVGSFVMPGFYGATVDGDIKLLDRGGGDITGSILANALSADLYENWTDVCGFLTADPRIVDDPLTIERITFDEMRELSYMGANVLHEEAIFPVREANIPIAILNTNQPDATGTIIRERVEPHANDPIITGIAGKKDFMSIYVGKTHMSNAVGFLRQVLSIFERYHVSVEHVPTGVDSFSIVVNGADVKDSIYSIVADIQREVHPDEVKVIDRLALVSVVGRNMSRRPGTAGKLLGTLGNAGINVRMISQSSQEITIIIGVDNDDFERTVGAIYDAFVIEEGE